MFVFMQSLFIVLVHYRCINLNYVSIISSLVYFRFVDELLNKFKSQMKFHTMCFYSDNLLKDRKHSNNAWFSVLFSYKCIGIEHFNFKLFDSHEVLEIYILLSFIIQNLHKLAILPPLEVTESTIRVNVGLLVLYYIVCAKNKCF